MIVREEMFEPLLEACPSFARAWQEFSAEWPGKGQDVPYYLALGDLASHLVGEFRSGKTEHFDAVFDVVENWHREGDAYVKEAATIGLLEGIQNAALNNNVDPSEFERWLKPETKVWWDKLNRFWTGEPQG